MASEGEGSLRILFVTGFFPPQAPMGAIRSAKLAEHWVRAGHDVRTIAIAFEPDKGAGQRQSATVVRHLPFSPPGQMVTNLKQRLVRFVPQRLMQPRRMGGAAANDTPGRQAALSKTPGHGSLGLRLLYRQALQFPDSFHSWIAPAVELGVSWAKDEKFDLIYSSGPPQSGHIAAARLSSRLALPWIAELRDLWVGDPYFDRHPLIHLLHERVARSTLSKAAACVVVTRTAAHVMKSIVKTPIAISYNGFDPEDFTGLETVEPLDPERLTIVHAGVIYPGRRDPSPLFKAMAQLGGERRQIRCLFYHDANGAVAKLARSYGVQDLVEIRTAIPRAEILKIERQADILLECRWQDPAGDGVIPGKLFEYIGARRPILSIGSLTGEAAVIVRDNELGLASNDPDEIKEMLLRSLHIKEQFGRIPDLVIPGAQKFTRELQFRKVDDLIKSVCRAAPRRALH